MAAGQGFKTFTTGEVLTAGDVNGYLMQGINVFANATARDAAITVPAEGQFAFTKDNNSLWYYDGAAWVASGATGDIEGVTAGVGISGGGTSGTVTVTNSMATAIDAKGDLVPGTGDDTFARLAVGANGTVLTADSAQATGLKWATPAAGGGKVGQVLSTLKTDTFSTASTSPVTITGLSQAITPSATSSKVLIMVSLSAGVSNTDSDLALFALSGGNTATYTGDTAGSRKRTVHWVRRPGDSATVAATNMPMTLIYLDSPATTSAVTYNATAAAAFGTAYVNRSGIDTDAVTFARSASTITVMEILA
jgi:hypothetical protein